MNKMLIALATSVMATGWALPAGAADTLDRATPWARHVIDNSSAGADGVKIADGIKQLKSDEGVLILTDMFGGTPSNLSYSFLEEGRIEVISGVNLPILIRASSARKNQSLVELAANLEAFGKKSISLASGILKGNKRA